MLPRNVDYITKLAEGGYLDKVISAFTRVFGGAKSQGTKSTDAPSAPRPAPVIRPYPDPAPQTSTGQLKTDTKTRVLSPMERTRMRNAFKSKQLKRLEGKVTTGTGLRRAEAARKALGVPSGR